MGTPRRPKDIMVVGLSVLVGASVNDLCKDALPGGGPLPRAWADGVRGSPSLLISPRRAGQSNRKVGKVEVSHPMWEN